MLDFQPIHGMIEKVGVVEKKEAEALAVVLFPKNGCWEGHLEGLGKKS